MRQPFMFIQDGFAIYMETWSSVRTLNLGLWRMSTQ